MRWYEWGWIGDPVEWHFWVRLAGSVIGAIVLAALLAHYVR